MGIIGRLYSQGAEMAIHEEELKKILQSEPPKSAEPDSIQPIAAPPTEIILQAEQPEIDFVNIGSLEHIADSQKQLSEVKKGLSNIIETMANNHSLVSRAAIFWGGLPLWQKIAGGVVVTGPTLAAAVIAHVGILFAISSVTAATYTGCGIVLDDHHRYTVNIADRLKTGIFSLADVLEITISQLEVIRVKFTEEIDKFKTENLKLTENVLYLTEQIESLSNQVELFVETEKLLRTTKDELEQRNEELKKTVGEHDLLIEKNQTELDKVKHAYEVSQTQLSEKIIELGTVRVSLGLEVEKARKVATTLQGTVQALAGTVIEDAKQRDVFQERLDGFLSDEKKSFDTVADRICQAEKELALVKEELKQSNERHQELLERQELQTDRLERINDAVLAAAQFKPNARLAQLLVTGGFYSLKKQMPIDQERHQAPAQTA